MSEGIGTFKSPNDSPGNGTIHPIALEQLAKFADVALTWPLVNTGRENRCQICMQNIWFTSDTKGEVFKYTTDEILALVVAHIRQRHPEAI